MGIQVFDQRVNPSFTAIDKLDVTPDE